MLRHALRLLFALALGVVPAISSADVYRWIDDLGVTHYTTDPGTIPRKHRGSSHAIVATPGAEAAPRATRAPADTAAPLPSAGGTGAPESSAAAPAARAIPPAPAGAAVSPEPAATRGPASGDPRAAEVAELEAQIATDRESLRKLISAKRWDSAELASDPSVREIAERLPRLQAELEALRAETVP